LPKNTDWKSKLPKPVTINPACDGVAWQKKIRDRRAREWEKRTPFWKSYDLELKNARVRPTSRAIANKIVMDYEWLGTMAPGSREYFGLFFGALCGGVECIAHPGFALPQEARSLQLPNDRIAYLARGACAFWTPPGSASKLISWTLKLLRHRGYAVAVAFADTTAGEIGTVYQSTNWLYVGVGKNKDDAWVSKSGKIFPRQSVTKWVKDNDASEDEFARLMIKQGWTRQRIPPKHKYYYVLTDGADRDTLLKRIEPRLKPYPKRT